MADDSDSMFAQAGFTLPKAATKADSSSAPVAASPASVPAAQSMFEAAGFSLPSKTAAAAVPTPPQDAWKDAEALENGVAAGTIKSAAAAPEPAKPGRGIVQALKDYPGHVLKGLIETVEGPGNIMASKTPSTSEALIPSAVNMAGLVSGTEFPRVGGAALAEKALSKVAPSTTAVNKLVEAIGPENVPSVINRLNENPRLAVADVSDPVRTMTQGLIDPAQPKAQNVIAGAVKERMKGATQAANDAYTEAMGPSPDVPAMVEGLKARAREAGQKAIQPALENAKAVDVSPVVAAIDEKLQPGIQAMLNPKTQLPLSDLQQELLRFKQELTAPSGETLFDPMRLHRVQSDMGDRAFQLSQSASGKERALGKDLRNFNEKLIDQIDDASGGAYRPARQQFKDAKDVSSAFESGFDTLKNRHGLTGALEDSPGALQNWMKDATPEEVVARRLGTRADIAQKINGVKNGALAGEVITRIEYNKDKLRILFGEKEANRLIRNMEDTRDIATTNAKLLANSKTAETLAGQKALEVPKVGGSNPLNYVAPVAAELLGQGAGLPGVGFGASLVLKGAHMAGQKFNQMNALARNAEFARNALAAGPARKETINALLAHPKVVRALKKSANALTAP